MKRTTPTYMQESLAAGQSEYHTWTNHPKSHLVDKQAMKRQPLAESYNEHMDDVHYEPNGRVKAIVRQHMD